MVTLLDIVKSKGTAHIKGLLLSSPSSSCDCKILKCSKHRKLGDKKILVEYKKNLPTEAYLKDYYDHKIL